jgi:nucleoid DNA-binding protein
MRKNDIANRLARATHVSKSDAADRIDAVIHRIVKSLRRGEEPRSGELAELIANAHKPPVAAGRTGNSSK